MPSFRIAKVNELIKNELAKTIQREIEFPKNTIVTVMRVQADADLKKATVFLGIFPKEEEKSTLTLIRKRSPLLQGILNRTLVMRYVPELKFTIEKESDKKDPIDEAEYILDNLDKLSG